MLTTLPPRKNWNLNDRPQRGGSSPCPSPPAQAPQPLDGRSDPIHGEIDLLRGVEASQAEPQAGPRRSRRSAPDSAARGWAPDCRTSRHCRWTRPSRACPASAPRPRRRRNCSSDCPAAAVPAGPRQARSSVTPGTAACRPAKSRSRSCRSRTASAGISSTQRARAWARPTMPGTFSVPLRRPCSWRPPSICRSSRTGGLRRRTYKAPMPFGP